MRATLCGGLISSLAILGGCSGGGDTTTPGAAGAGGAAGASGAAGAGGVANTFGGAGAGGAAGTLGAAGVGGAAAASGGTAGSVGGAAGSGGAAGGALGCDKDLSGTWDLVATRLKGGASSGSAVIAPETLTITVQTGGTRRLSYLGQGTPTVVWQKAPNLVQPIDVTRAPAALNAGSIPLSVGGDWQFSANRMTCKSKVTPASATASCDVRPTAVWPSGAIPMPAPNVNYTATKTTDLSAQFGFLGGEWKGTSAASGNGCTMRAEGNTIQLSCRTRDVWDGTANLTVGSDCVASGLTASGYELSARKR